MNKHFKSVFVFLIIATILFTSTINSYAVSGAPEEIDPCKPEELVYQKSVRIFNLDIRRTVDNFITSIFISLFANVSGLNPDAVMGCQYYIYGVLEKSLRGNYDIQSIKDFGECSDTGDDVCAELVGDMEDNAFISFSDSVQVRAVRSSMLGFSNLVEGAVRKEPLPVNLAYYWDQSISDIPYFGKTLAAGGDAYKNLPIVAAAYGLWALSVKIALGLMSAIILFTGIMIVMRKKVNQQLVVSVQYAIPKIIIAIFLILFSYPIGAAITSISWGLFRGSFGLVFSALLGLEPGTDFPSGILNLSLIIMTLRLAQGGFFYVSMVLIVGILLLILKLIIYFKAFLIYIKMVFSIMTAPLEFALGAVPGSENRLKDWFIRMAKYALTIFGMGVVIPVTLVFGLSVMLAYATGAGGETGGWGILIAILTPLIVVVLGFGLGINMEKHVNNMFGDKPRNRK